jgi:altronate dehydratase large subunit
VLAGAQLLLFTTGVGNSYASALAPTLKLSADAETCVAPGGLLDSDASPAFTGAQSMDEAALGLRRKLIQIASGRATWGEILGEGDEVLSRYGPAL